jgi:SAM-dependent methyltransferase
MNKQNDELVQEIKSFEHIWKGGFRTGYQPKRNQKDIETYLQSILQPHHTVFEIGCGGGQWTKFISPLVKSLICNDAKTAESNHLFSYLNSHNVGHNVIFHQAQDFNLNYLENESLDIVFSYDVFCHISYSGQKQYIKNLYTKCKPGCLLMIMYADAHKYAISEPEHIRQSFSHYLHNDLNITLQKALDDCDGKNSIGRWYYIGIDNFINMCLEYGYTILEKDLNIDKTNPITLFRR